MRVKPPSEASPAEKQKPSGEPEGSVQRNSDDVQLTVFLVPRLNFEVNFSTRPAVSTMRFSPV